MASIYGQGFDNLAEIWKWNENEHDKMHPDRSECGGVGQCPMMREASDLKSSMIDMLEKWRKKADKSPQPHEHRASCHGAIGELLCGER